MYETIKQDLLKIKNGVIVHQCNCFSDRPAGLSADMFAKYPIANTYSKTKLRTPGTIESFSPPSSSTSDITIINMYSQYYPGAPSYRACQDDKTLRDDASQREKWFVECLVSLGKRYYGSSTTIYFPYRIGCGLAKGDWKIYKSLIMLFSEKYGVDVKVCKK